MPITWNEFETMYDSMQEDVEKINILAGKQKPEDRAEYDRLCERAFQTANKIYESKGEYLPDLSIPGAREKWQDMKAEAESIRLWLLKNKGDLWSS